MSGGFPGAPVPERPDPAHPEAEDAPGGLAGPPLQVRRSVFVFVLMIVAASVGLTLIRGFRVGGYVLAAALLTASVARAVLPPQYCLGLIVRSRRLDVLTTLVLAVTVAFAAAIVPGG
jgi:hypothetical protein